MKKRIVTAALFCIAFAGTSLFADIGENFERAGIAYRGGGNIWIDLDDFMDPSNEDFAVGLNIFPGFEFFMMDYLSYWIEPHFQRSNGQGRLDSFSRKSRPVPGMDSRG